MGGRLDPPSPLALSVFQGPIWPCLPPHSANFANPSAPPPQCFYSGMSGTADMSAVGSSWHVCCVTTYICNIYIYIYTYNIYIYIYMAVSLLFYVPESVAKSAFIISWARASDPGPQAVGPGPSARTLGPGPWHTNWEATSFFTFVSTVTNKKSLFIYMYSNHF